MLGGARRRPTRLAPLRVPSHARDRLEQLLRYCARPAISHDRLRLLGDGRVQLTLKSPRFDGTSHLVLTASELIERIPRRWR